MAEKGYQTYNLTNTTSDALQDIIDNSVNYIKTHQYPIINSTLIPQKAHIIQNLTDAFVKPPIYIHGDEKFEDVSLQDILKNHANTMLLGVHEAGKTVLLFRLLMELADNYYQYGVIPVYVDFLQIGNPVSLYCFLQSLREGKAEAGFEPDSPQQHGGIRG